MCTYVYLYAKVRGCQIYFSAALHLSLFFFCLFHVCTIYIDLCVLDHMCVTMHVKAQD